MAGWRPQQREDAARGGDPRAPLVNHAAIKLEVNLTINSFTGVLEEAASRGSHRPPQPKKEAAACRCK